MLKRSAHAPAQPRKRSPRRPFDILHEIEEVIDLCSRRADPRTLMASLAERVVHRYRLGACGFWTVNNTEGTLDLAAQAGGRPFSTSEGHVLRESAAWSQVLTRAAPPVFSVESLPDDPLTRWARANHYPVIAIYPLQLEGDPVMGGVMAVPTAKAPTPSVMKLLQLHARLAAMALQDAERRAHSQTLAQQLAFLSEASKTLGSTLDLEEVFSRILDVAKSQVEAERGTLFLVDEQAAELWSWKAHGLERLEIRLPLGKGIAGHVAVTGEITNIPDAYADPRFNPEVDRLTGFHTRNILCLPIRNKAGKIIAVLQLLNKLQGAFTNEDADLLTMISGNMALALENAQLHKELVEKESFEREMALARGIQQSLLPETAPELAGFDIAVLNEPSHAVGGDYYDFIQLDPDHLLVVIADVEGKGVSSALVMSNLQATLHALVMHLPELSEAAAALNRTILAHTKTQKYLSLFLGILDVPQTKIRYVNCGHIPPLVVRPGRDPLSLTEGGMVIGLFAHASYAEGQAKLSPGDVIVLCTDGITEAMNTEDEEYGNERLAAQVARHASRSAAEIVAEVNLDVADFSRHGTHSDDKVMIAVKVLGK